MRKALFGFSVLLCLCLSGCTRLIFWNPLFHEAELDRKVSFNLDGVAVEVSSLGFLNSTIGPHVVLKVKNFTDQQVRIYPSSIQILIEEDTLWAENDPAAHVVLTPGKSEKVELVYDYVLGRGPVGEHEGQLYESPEPSRLVLHLGKVDVASRTLRLPSIEYVYAYRRFRRTRFI